MRSVAIRPRKRRGPEQHRVRRGNVRGLPKRQVQVHAGLIENGITKRRRVAPLVVQIENGGLWDVGDLVPVCPNVAHGMGVEANKHIDVRMGIGRSPGQGPFEVNRADAGLLNEIGDDARHNIPLGLQCLIVDARNTPEVHLVVTSQNAFVQAFAGLGTIPPIR